MGCHWLEWLGMAFFGLIPILLVLVLVVVVKYLIGGRRSNALDGERKPDALAILEERYARGEVGREEYVQKRDDLKQG